MAEQQGKEKSYLSLGGSSGNLPEHVLDYLVTCRDSSEPLEEEEEEDSITTALFTSQQGKGMDSTGRIISKASKGQTDDKKTRKKEAKAKKAEDTTTSTDNDAAAPLVLERQSARGVTPGAFALRPCQAFRRNETSNTSSESTVDREEEPAIAAELVDEEQAEAALREIDRLQRELKALKESQVVPAEIVVAEPIPGTTIDTIDDNTDEKQNQLFHNDKRKKRLRYASLSLHGREQEKGILQAFLNRQQQGQHVQRQLIVIKGHSGVGKTALAHSLKAIVQEQNGLFVQGKFDWHKTNEPYYGITEACRQVCHAIWELRTSRSRTKSFHEAHQKLSELFLPQDSQLLTKLVPDLAKIRNYFEQEEETNTENTVEEELEAPEAKARLHYLFRRFIRFVSSYFAPFVYTLDDLQWSDPASLELMQALLTDTENPNLLMIGLYRSNEVDDNGNMDSHILTTTLNNLKEKSNDNGFQISELSIGNLTLPAVQSAIMDLLSLSADSNTARVQELADICHKRTHGNVFFLISFLAMLEEEGLVEYNTTDQQYSWDIAQIKSETVATSNIVDLMKHKTTKLSPDLRLLLSIAACLGNSFEASQLEVVWKQFNSSGASGVNKDSSLLTVEERLSSALAEGFLERLDDVNTTASSKKYRWIHDKVQETAFTLIPAGESSDFKYRVGSILHQQMNQEELDENIFLVTNLLNETSAAPLDEPRRFQLAELNLKATQRAIQCSAFASAGKYAGKGIALLPADSWTNHYQVTLDLYSFAAEANEVVGNYDDMKLYCDIILAQDIPVLDQVRAYTVLSSQMAATNNHVDAVSLLLKVLKRLGCKFPKSSPGILCSTLTGVVKLQMGIKDRTPAEVERLEIMTDPLQLEKMKLLDKLITYSHLCGSDLCGLAILKSMRLTLKHGVCEVSPTAFVATATILTGVIGDLQASSQIADYALLLAKKLNSRAALARVKFIGSWAAFAWTRPMRSNCSLLLEAYADGMCCGDTETAMFASCSYIMQAYVAGLPLPQIEADCALYTKQMKDLKREQAYDYTVTFWQPVRNLMGLSSPDNASYLQGDVVLDLQQFVADHKDNRPGMSMIYSQQMQLYTIFGKHKEGADLFLQHGYDFQESPGHPLLMNAVCLGGISAFAMARTQRKYKKYAAKAHSTVKNWVRKGNPNVKHYEALFDAEHAVLRGKSKAAEKNYQSAIAVALRGGYTQDAALANERYGEFMLTVQEDKGEAGHYFSKAMGLYSDWGAVKKVELMQQQYGSVLPEKGAEKLASQQGCRSVSASTRRRQKFVDKHVKQESSIGL